MNKLSNSFDLLTSPDVEYELHIGSYIDNKYTAHISKESYDKLLNNKALFTTTTNNTTTFITQYKGFRKVQVLDDKYKEIEHYFENKKKLKTIHINNTSIKINIAEEEQFNTKNKKNLVNPIHTRLRKRISKISKDKLWRYDFTEIYYDIASNKLNNKSLKDPSYSVEIEYIHQDNNKKTLFYKNS